MNIKNAEDFTLWRWFWLILTDAIFMPLTFTVIILVLQYLGLPMSF